MAAAILMTFWCGVEAQHQRRHWQQCSLPCASLFDENLSIVHVLEFTVIHFPPWRAITSICHPYSPCLVHWQSIPSDYSMASVPVSQEVAVKYQELMQACQQLQSKIVELEIDRNEHQ